ncbi:hypothetical protein NCCP1664_05660 [Zafaria cholistanensis]|uniref:HTH tetR-type domain-containing protein n=1 Tax=Zafaria cholistanensis TaxID=1682741 RepID=A0A5A7NN97_9MICC|nr:TetR/AcrR family transcriptional regulator [Zafaria cholistanensis]GER22069.1 hypothetical protein NCCP1664_05660 [Zafaria cholistanensis]
MKQITGTDQPATEGRPAADGRSARWDGHRRQRRLDLVKAARGAVHRLGPGAPMEDIAAAAGTSKSVFYRYFGDKDGLRQAVGEVVIGRTRAEVLAAGRGAASAEEGLRAMVSAYLRMAETSPNVYFFVTTDREAGSGPAARAHGRELDAFFDEVLAMMREGMHAYLASRGTGPERCGVEESGPVDNSPEGPGGTAAALAFWPRAALGMVRTAGEAWLRQAPGPERPSAAELAHTLTGWLAHGIAGSTRQETAERHPTWPMPPE